MYEKGWLVVLICLGLASHTGAAENAAAKTDLLKPGVQVVLTNTPAGLAGSRGTAELRLHSGGAATGMELVIDTQGLRWGNYRVEAVLKGNGATRYLGPLVLHDPTTAPDREAGDSKREDNTTHQSEALSSRSLIPWPPDLAPGDVASIRVTNSGGTTLLESPVPAQHEGNPANGNSAPS